MARLHAALAALPEHGRRRGERAVPGMLVALLGADMERHAMRLQPELEGVLQHVHGHGRLAAELARQRPFRPDAVGQDAAEHPGAGRRAGDLLDLGLAVDRVEADAEREGARDVALLLDRVAVGDAVGRGAGREHHLDLGDRGGVEAGAELGQQRQHLRRRVGLHGVEHAGVGQRLGEGIVVVAHDVEVDDEARARRRCALRRNSRMRSVMALSPQLKGRLKPSDVAVFQSLPPARDGDAQALRALQPLIAALDWIGETPSARPAMMNKPLR